MQWPDAINAFKLEFPPAKLIHIQAEEAGKLTCIWLLELMLLHSFQRALGFNGPLISLAVVF